MTLSNLRRLLAGGLLTAACLHAPAADCPGDLLTIAKTGATVGNSTITAIRARQQQTTGVSINNRGTIAFTAQTTSGASTVFVRTPDGQLRQLPVGLVEG